jgi:hypothetical protein
MSRFSAVHTLGPAPVAWRDGECRSPPIPGIWRNGKSPLPPAARSSLDSVKNLLGRASSIQAWVQALNIKTLVSRRDSVAGTCVLGAPSLSVCTPCIVWSCEGQHSPSCVKLQQKDNVTRPYMHQQGNCAMSPLQVWCSEEHMCACGQAGVHVDPCACGPVCMCVCMSFSLKTGGYELTVEAAKDELGLPAVPYCNNKKMENVFWAGGDHQFRPSFVTPLHSAKSHVTLYIVRSCAGHPTGQVIGGIRETLKPPKTLPPQWLGHFEVVLPGQGLQC